MQKKNRSKSKPSWKSLKQLRSFIGRFNHLSKFIPIAASLFDKFRLLLKENQEKNLKNIKLPVKKFDWGEEHRAIFDSIKTAVANISKENYYDSKRHTTIKCDASHNGLEATLGK